MNNVFQRRNLAVILGVVCFVILTWPAVLKRIYTKGVQDGHTASEIQQFAKVRQVQKESIIPSDAQLMQMDLKSLMTTLQSYQAHFEFLCVDQKRIGTVFDGGKQVCMDPEVRPRTDGCLVYSVGSNKEFSFEADAIKWLGCEVHTFDPYVAGASPPAGCTFHNVGLGASTYTQEKDKRKLEFKTLDVLMADLNHSERIIDVLKVDIEQDEWDFMNSVIRSGLLSRKVKQFQVELHWYERYNLQNRTNTEYTLGTLRNLYGAGFRIFSIERNIYCQVCTYKEPVLGGAQITTHTEFSYINQRFVSEYHDKV